jgi:hypothetical protein
MQDYCCNGAKKHNEEIMDSISQWLFSGLAALATKNKNTTDVNYISFETF